MGAIFIAQATNTHLSLRDQIVILVVLMLTSKGSAGVAGAGFVTLAATLASMRSRLEGQQVGPGVTGATSSHDVRGTIDLALRLQPETKNVVVIAGTSEFEQYWLKIIDQLLHDSTNPG